jgi:hypothetical protein
MLCVLVDTTFSGKLVDMTKIRIAPRTNESVILLLFLSPVTMRVPTICLIPTTCRPLSAYFCVKFYVDVVNTRTEAGKSRNGQDNRPT